MARRPACSSCIVCVLSVALGAGSIAAQHPQGTPPNYKLAEKFSSDRLGKFLYSTSVRPKWIGKTDRFFYSFKTSTGTRYWLVDPKARKKRELFDHDKLAAALSAATQKPVTGTTLRLSSLKVEDDLSKLSFGSEGRLYEYLPKTGTLTDKGKAPRSGARNSRGGRGRQRGGRIQEQIRQMTERLRQRGGRGSAGGTAPGGRGARRDHRNLAPDKSAYVYGQGHNLFYVEGKQVPAKDKTKANKTKAKLTSGETNDNGVAESTARTDGAAKKTDDKPKMEWAYNEKAALQLTKDGAESHSFASGSQRGSRGRGRGRTQSTSTTSTPADPKRKVRPNVSWSKDSKSFWITRRDSRGVQELYLVDSVAEPRPTLRKYSYPMPGEEKVRRSELHVFNRKNKKLHRITPKWKDESYINVDWVGDTHEIRFLRRDRLQRNIELCSVDPVNESGKLLFKEGFKAANLSPQTIRYLPKRKQFIWWSERSGWGHFYLHDTTTGELKNAITTGPFRASRIVHVDEEAGQMWFRANGREKNESLYHDHIYRVDLDGSGLVCLDRGDATHRTTLSPTRRFLVDNCSRVDMPPKSILRDASGAALMTLEETDVTKLEEMGWRKPERFVVKAADGVTDLYGNMWKPFDFDPNRRYPIIAHVYPGPQQEGVSHTFSASNGRQQLAQIGFIVIQVGHRGGAPTRSKEYAAYGYFNLRDYGLADKKAAIEQLADRHAFIDIDRVGIYGHSGGGFMTAAAMMKPPYNDFFKVGVASAGNHDNNIYNSNWSERYHGLKEVEVEEKKATEGVRRAGRARGQGRTVRTTNEAQDKKKTQDKKAKAQDKKKKFEIKVPTNAELAANLKGHLLLVHGEIDNNVHPANTMRLVDALIKANKRFDLLIIPGARHGFGRAQKYFQHRMWEHFAEHLLGHNEAGADILKKTRR